MMIEERNMLIQCIGMILSIGIILYGIFLSSKNDMLWMAVGSIIGLLNYVLFAIVFPVDERNRVRKG